MLDYDYGKVVIEHVATPLTYTIHSHRDMCGMLVAYQVIISVLIGVLTFCLNYKVVRKNIH
jgi:hypothetical protein